MLISLSKLLSLRFRTLALAILVGGVEGSGGLILEEHPDLDAEGSKGDDGGRNREKFKLRIFPAG